MVGFSEPVAIIVCLLSAPSVGYDLRTRRIHGTRRHADDKTGLV